MKNTPSMGDYGLIETEVWTPEKQIQKSIFKSSGALHPYVLQYMDIPYLYKQTEYGMDFMEALADS